MKQNLSKEQRISFLEYGKILGKVNKAWKFLDYEIRVKSQDYAHLSGPDISKQMNQDEFENYNSRMD